MSYYEKFKIIFDLAKKELGTNILGVNQITVAYYRLFTAKDNSKTIDRFKMNTMLYSISKRKYKRFIKRIRIGKYSFVENTEYKLNTNVRKSNPNNKCCKKVEFKGKIYNSMRELADTLGLHYSTVSHHYKRNNGDLSTLGSHRII